MKLFPTAKYVLGLVVAWLWREWNAPSLNFGAGNYETHWERDAEGGGVLATEWVSLCCWLCIQREGGWSSRKGCNFMARTCRGIYPFYRGIFYPSCVFSRSLLEACQILAARLPSPDLGLVRRLLYPGLWGKLIPKGAITSRQAGGEGGGA